MEKSLGELLKRKREEADSVPDRYKSEKENWLRRVDELYRTINQWLARYEKRGDIQFEYEEVSRQEELIGPYSVNCMIIRFFNGRKIRLTPVGLHVVAAKGRIDMDLDAVGRHIMIVGTPEGKNWEFAERTGARIEPFPFSRENFEALLKEFVEAF
ncbi:MAG: hypothetical protein HY423_12415 [Candidatus Lambdaproteobacteria bacterium]|nr:hypothetical protein [Candidatus Lambdaproteobacteria bacterium]